MGTVAVDQAGTVAGQGIGAGQDGTAQQPKNVADPDNPVAEQGGTVTVQGETAAEHRDNSDDLGDIASDQGGAVSCAVHH